MNLTETGVDEFIYPISRSEMVDVRDTIITGIENLTLEERSLALIDLHFTLEMMSLYRALALVNRMDQNDYQPYSPNSRLIPAIIDRSKPRLPDLLYSLAEGIQERKVDFRRMGRDIQWNGLSKLSCVSSYNDNIIAHPGSGLVSYHACSDPRLIKCTRHYDWFDSVDEPVSSGVSTEIICNCINVVENAFNRGNEDLHRYLRDYVEQWLTKALNLTFTHFSRLIKYNRLPDELWTGTGGNIWTRILRLAVLESGGQVVGHDHPIGAVFGCDQSVEITELTSCTEFMTLTSTQAENLRRHSQFRFNDIAPTRIIPPPELDRLPMLRPPRSIKRGISRRRATWASKIDNIMYVAGIYNGDASRLNFTLPDPVYIDWQIRLLHNFDNKTSYDILCKPHPHGPFDAPNEFEDIPAVDMIYERFEHVVHLPDAFIFDTPQSTAFSIALLTDKPVILVDLGITEWSPTMRRSLEKRCAIVDGWIDNNNRAHVNWSEVCDGIEQAVELDNFSFADAYLYETGKI